MNTEARYRASPRDYPMPPPPSKGEAVAQWLEESEDVVDEYHMPIQRERDSRGSLPRRPPSRDRPQTGRRESANSQRKLSNASSNYYPSGYSLYPAPSKPLPALPTPKTPGRVPSRDSSDRSSISTHRSSQVSAATTSTPDATSVSFSPPPPRRSRVPQNFYKPPDPSELLPPPRRSSRPAEVVFWKLLQSDDKKNGPIHHLDMSSSLSTLATKHGNNIIKVWSTAGGSVQQVIKFSSYTAAQSRSREYLIRSHAILAEPTNLIAIATRFGRQIEIWNWAKKKCLQSIDDADRWTSSQIESYDGALSSFAIYGGEKGLIDLYRATPEKKPFVKTRTIDLNKGDLPFVPQYPELALSRTSPLLVIAAGPRPPRQGHPPPEKETLLVAWETNEGGSNKPYRVARPWQHKELDTAIPCDVATYGSAVVSIWIPASFHAVPATNGGSGYNLSPVTVPYRYVLVWDLAANSTRTFGIPNTTSCLSPDCRFVAYCHATGANIGARGSIVILDVMTGKEVWSWPDPEALAIDYSPRRGFEQFDDLSRVSELHFSSDGKFLNVGDLDGHIGMYEVRESTGDRLQLHMI
nr:WD40 repeat domain containing protein [Trichoderma psychrophilum]